MDVAPLPDFSSRLAIGPELPDTVDPGARRGTGQADGVIFLGEARDLSGLKIVAASEERRALRFLRAHDPMWYATRGRRGFDLPSDYWPLLRGHNSGVGKIVQAAAQKFEQPIVALLLAGPHAVDCIQPQHLRRWHLRAIPGEEKIWALFYV